MAQIKERGLNLGTPRPASRAWAAKGNSCQESGGSPHWATLPVAQVNECFHLKGVIWVGAKSYEASLIHFCVRYFLQVYYVLRIAFCTWGTRLSNAALPPQYLLSQKLV